MVNRPRSAVVQSSILLTAQNAVSVPGFDQVSARRIFNWKRTSLPLNSACRVSLYHERCWPACIVMTACVTQACKICLLSNRNSALQEHSHIFIHCLTRLDSQSIPQLHMPVCLYTAVTMSCTRTLWCSNTQVQT